MTARTSHGVAERSLDIDSATQSSRPGVQPDSGTGALVLVVEDEPDLAEFVMTALKQLGYRTLYAANAGEALALLQSHQPIDLLLTDVVMPGQMNGLELARAARSCRPGLPVLVTSDYSGKTSDGAAATASRERILAKPYTMSQLARRVREALASAPTKVRHG